MKFILKVVLIGTLTYLTALVLPWWSLVLCAFLVNVAIGSGGVNSYLSGFLGVGLVWMIASWIIFTSADGNLVDRIAPMLNANEGVVLVVYTALLGAFMGGLGGLAGSYLRKIFSQSKPGSSYY